MLAFMPFGVTKDTVKAGWLTFTSPSLQEPFGEEEGPLWGEPWGGCEPCEGGTSRVLLARLPRVLTVSLGGRIKGRRSKDQWAGRHRLRLADRALCQGIRSVKKERFLTDKNILCWLEKCEEINFFCKVTTTLLFSMVSNMKHLQVEYSVRIWHDVTSLSTDEKYFGFLLTIN